MCGSACEGVGEKMRTAFRDDPVVACCGTILLAIAIIAIIGIAGRIAIGLITSTVFLSLVALGLILYSASKSRRGECC